MMQRDRRKLIFGTALAIAAATAMVMLGGFTDAQAQFFPPPDDDAQDPPPVEEPPDDPPPPEEQPDVEDTLPPIEAPPDDPPPPEEPPADPPPPIEEPPVEEPPVEEPPIEEPPVVDPDVDLMIGVYNPQAVLEEHPLHDDLWEAASAIQVDMQEAQEEGDYERIQELQRDFEQERNTILDEFEADVDDAIAEIVDDTDIQVVALEVVYAAEGIDTTDITQDIIELVNDVEEDEEEFQLPEDFQFE